MTGPEIFFSVTTACTSILLLFLGASMETRNLRSLMIFKLFPLIFGAIAGIRALIDFGIISIGG